MVAITVTTLTVPSSASGRRSPQAPKRGLAGAAGGVYIGPTRPNSASHTVTSAGGGVEDTTGYRESDNYANDGGTAGLTGGRTSNTVSRPTGRTAFYGDGVTGGSSISASAGAKVIDPTGRAQDTGTDRLGRSLAGVNGGRYTYTNFDGRSKLDGDGGLAASSGRGTTATGTGPADSITGETIARVPAAAVRPVIGNAADPAAGTVGVVGGAGKIQIDLHADDITGGASGLKGAEVTVFKRRADTDEDYDLVGVFRADGGTDITDAITGLTAATYAVYARYLLPVRSRFSKSFYGPAVLFGTGPRSDRGTVVVT